MKQPGFLIVSLDFSDFAGITKPIEAQLFSTFQVWFTIDYGFGICLLFLVNRLINRIWYHSLHSGRLMDEKQKQKSVAIRPWKCENWWDQYFSNQERMKQKTIYVLCLVHTYNQTKSYAQTKVLKATILIVEKTWYPLLSSTSQQTSNNSKYFRNWYLIVFGVAFTQYRGKLFLFHTCTYWNKYYSNFK